MTIPLPLTSPLSAPHSRSAARDGFRRAHRIARVAVTACITAATISAAHAQSSAPVTAKADRASHGAHDSTTSPSTPASEKCMPPTNTVPTSHGENETIVLRVQQVIMVQQAMQNADPTVLGRVRAIVAKFDTGSRVQNFLADPLRIDSGAGHSLLNPPSGVVLKQITDSLTAEKLAAKALLDAYRAQNFDLEMKIAPVLKSRVESERQVAQAAERTRAFYTMMIPDLPTLGSTTGQSSSFGLPSEADILAGIFKYLEDRTEAEVVYAMLSELHDKIADDTVLQALIPKTYRLVPQLDSMSVKQFLPSLRSAVLADLEAAPAALVRPPVLSIPCAEDPASPKRAEYELLSEGVSVLNGIRTGQPVVAELAILSTITVTDVQSDNIRLPLRLLGVLAREYRLSDGSVRNAITTGNGDFRRFFLGFLLNDAIVQGGLSINDSAHAATQLVRIKAYVQSGEIDLSSLVTEIRTLDSTVARLSDPKTSKSDTAVIEAVASGLTVAAHVLTTAVHFAQPSDTRITAGTEEALAVLSDGVTLLQAAVRHDYPRLVIVTVALLKTAFPDVVDSSHKPIHWRPTTVRYLSAAADLASAKTPSDVEQVLSDVAEPVGSARSKRGSVGGGTRISFTINAYFGANGAIEVSAARGAPGSAEFAAGLAVPIGPEIAFGFKGGSFSVFVPLVDLGTLASYRFGSDTLKATPTVSWRQVLAPGADLVWGITQKFPISLGFGVEYAPGLRQTRTTNIAIDVIRWQLFFGIDEPLFRF
jgi:hypothetical protein